MGFAGHVFDMIRRDKAYRDQRKQLRERGKLRHDTYIGQRKMPSNVTVEELDHIKQQTKTREAQQQHFFFRTTLIVLAILIVISLILVITFSFIL